MWTTILRLITFIYLNELLGVIGSLTTLDQVTGMMGDMVSMECNYVNPPGRKWYVIQWKRRNNGTEPETLVTLQNNFLSEDTKPLGASWNNDLEPSFRNRARTNIRQDENDLKFNLEIYDFNCGDRGLYSCEMIGDNSASSQTRLVLKAKPEKPVINNDVIIVDENSTCELECEVLAGLPPVRLTWLISTPGSSKFEVIENLPEQIVKEGSDCRPKVIQHVQLLVTKENSGSMFRCQVDNGMSDAMTEELYDVVQVKIPDPVVPSSPAYTLSCTGNECLSDGPVQGDVKNSARSLLGSLLPSFICMLICIIL